MGWLAFGSLYPDYRIDAQVISTEVGGAFGSLDDRLRSNIAPELEVRGDTYRSARVGEPVSLSVYARDPDDFPARSKRPPPRTPEQIYRPPSSIVASSGPGLRFSWSVYRGPESAASFEPAQMKTYTDTRVYANSPWSPPYTIPEPPRAISGIRPWYSTDRESMCCEALPVMVRCSPIRMST